MPTIIPLVLRAAFLAWPVNPFPFVLADSYLALVQSRLAILVLQVSRDMQRVDADAAEVIRNHSIVSGSSYQNRRRRNCIHVSEIEA